mmetsp:Transcript_17535/g.37730  ORF Transcript_17535/g.37730 Transcript_17535/m.37730 type:complete len:282 (+) Transcript_17535:1609-2454(+)
MGGNQEVCGAGAGSPRLHRPRDAHAAEAVPGQRAGGRHALVPLVLSAHGHALVRLWHQGLWRRERDGGALGAHAAGDRGDSASAERQHQPDADGPLAGAAAVAALRDGGQGVAVRRVHLSQPSERERRPMRLVRHGAAARHALPVHHAAAADAARARDNHQRQGLRERARRAPALVPSPGARAAAAASAQVAHGHPPGRPVSDAARRLFGRRRRLYRRPPAPALPPLPGSRAARADQLLRRRASAAAASALHLARRPDGRVAAGHAPGGRAAADAAGPRPA